MTDTERTEQIVRARMHGQYLSRRCTDLVTLSRELLGLHCWFHRNVYFSAIIRGADVFGWKTALTKTWLYRGTLHGVAEDDLPTLLALHSGNTYLDNYFGRDLVETVADEVIAYMNDGVYSRAEFRKIFAEIYDAQTVEAMFSPWGGVFVHLARQGRVSFRDMTSRDFDLISAEPTRTREQVLPELFARFIAVYGPATLADAAWFFGFINNDAKVLETLPLDEYSCFELNGKTYYYTENNGMNDIPELTLLSGFDPLIVSYVDRSAVLPPEYRKKVILSSGICLPTVAVNGRVAGMWNIKKNVPTVEFFEPQPKRIVDKTFEMVEDMQIRTAHLR